MSDHHILVIDDDERLRLLLRRFLEESGYALRMQAAQMRASFWTLLILICWLSTL